MLTNTERESIKKALETATPGEWQIDKGQHYHAVISKKGSLHSVVCSYVDKDNIELLSNAPTWLKQQDEMIEQLLAEVKQITEDYGIVKQALENDQEHHRRMIKERFDLQAEVRAKDAEIERMKTCRECGGTGYVEVCSDPYGTMPCVCAEIDRVWNEYPKLKASEEKTKAALAIAVEALEKVKSMGAFSGNNPYFHLAKKCLDRINQSQVLKRIGRE